MGIPDGMAIDGEGPFPEGVDGRGGVENCEEPISRIGQLAIESSALCSAVAVGQPSRHGVAHYRTSASEKASRAHLRVMLAEEERLAEWISTRQFDPSTHKEWDVAFCYYMDYGLYFLRRGVSKSKNAIRKGPWESDL